MSKQYILEIYEPGSEGLSAEATFESDKPFLQISVGDLLNNRTWPNSNYKGKIRKVTKLEHFIWEVDNAVKHKIGIFTQEVEDLTE